MKDKKTLAVDFDGVVHRYSRGWYDGSIYDPPMDGAVAALAILKEKYEIVIFTARPDLVAVELWFEKYFDWVPHITNTKPSAFAYIDDRAVRFSTWESILKWADNPNKENKKL